MRRARRAEREVIGCGAIRSRCNRRGENDRSPVTPVAAENADGKLTARAVCICVCFYLLFQLLCLGAGESGKSTIIKQLVFLHKQQVVSDEEKQAYVRVLHGNVLTCISTLLKEAADFGYEMDETAQRHAEIVESFDSRQLLTLEVVQSIEYLWLQCPAISATYARRNEFWILDGSEWYFNNAYRFLEEGYRPNEEDMIMARKRTTGVVETQLKYGSVAWSVVDVGGQRSERRKWSRAHTHANTGTRARSPSTCCVTRWIGSRALG